MSAADLKVTPPLEASRRNQWNLVCGLSWAAFLLLLLALWVHSKYWDTGSAFMGWALGALAIVAALAAGWWTIQLRGLAALKVDARDKQQTHLSGLAAPLLYGLSAVLLLLMVILLFQAPTKFGAFPEVSSGVLLAVLGLLSGFFLSSGTTKSFSQQQVLEAMTRHRQQVMMGSLILGGLFFLLGIVVFVRNRPWTDYFPEGAGAMLLGVIFLAIGLWHTLATPKELTVSNMRILVLVAGGTAGLVIALMTAFRAWLWRSLVFSGGMSTWQGDRAWQLWLCIWLELLGLALMFGSLYLAQADIRFNPTLRRLLYGYNAAFTGLLVLAALVALNVVVYASLPYTFNWTKGQGFYSISEKSKKVLQSLKKPTTVWILMNTRVDAYSDIKNLLENCTAYSSLLTVKEISPDKQLDDYAILAKRYPKLQEARAAFHGASKGSGLLIVYGTEDPNPKAPAPAHVFIPAEELADSDINPEAAQGQPTRQYVFKGEDVVITQLSFLGGGEQKPVIYFTQSNEEVDIKNKTVGFQEGGGMLADKLEAANYVVRPLKWGVPDKKSGENVAFSQKEAKAPHRVPEDGKIVIIAWPKIGFTKEVIEGLTEFMSTSRGGKLIVLSSVVDLNRKFVKVGLEDFIKKYGVEMKDNFVVHLVENQPLSKVAPLCYADAKNKNKTDNPIPRAFQDVDFLLDTARSVKPLPGATGGFTAEVILEVKPKSPLGEQIFVETDMSVLESFYSYVQNLGKKNLIESKKADEAVPVGLAVSDGKNPRLVVFGDGRMASNGPLTSAPYHDLIASSVEWLGDRPENIGIPPKKTGFYALPVTHKGFSRQRLILLPFGLMVLGLMGLGLGVWVVRRP